MWQKEKLLEQLRAKKRNFTFDDAESLLKFFNHKRLNKGKTSRNRIIFVSTDHPSILMHNPNPRKELLEYIIKELI